MLQKRHRKMIWAGETEGEGYDSLGLELPTDLVHGDGSTYSMGDRWDCKRLGMLETPGNCLEEESGDQPRVLGEM